MNERRVIIFKPYKPPVFDTSCLVGGYTTGRLYSIVEQLQIASDLPSVQPMAKICLNSLYGHINPVPKKRNPLSLKVLAGNVLLKHRPHKDWVEFCSYSKSFRDQLITPQESKKIGGVILPPTRAKGRLS